MRTQESRSTADYRLGRHMARLNDRHA
jgi:hypothetical protein